MKLSRRRLLTSTLFGAAGIGLRSLATGLPITFLLNPARALAESPNKSKPPSPTPTYGRGGSRSRRRASDLGG